MRFWRNTSLANLAAGQTATLTPHVLGYESDEDRDNGFRPQGAIQLSTTTVGVSQYLLDYGNTTGPGTATHHLTLYRAPSGALVFGAGTMRWSWGLDAITSTKARPSIADAAGHGQPVRRHGHAARHATVGTGTGDGVDRYRCARLRRSRHPLGGTSFPVGQTVTITGTAIGHRRRSGRRRRGLGRQRHELAPGFGSGELVIFVATDDARIGGHQVESDRRQPKHADTDSRGHGQRAGRDRAMEFVRHDRRPDARQRERSESGRTSASSSRRTSTRR